MPCGEGHAALLGRMLDALIMDAFGRPASAVHAMGRHWGDVSRALEPR